MEVLGQVDDRLHRDLGVRLGAPGADLFGGDRAAGFLEPGHAANAEDGRVFEVDVQHHLPLAAPEWLLVGSSVRSRVGWMRARLPTAMARRTSRESVEPRRSCWWASEATAASRSSASARSRSPSTLTRPVTPTSARAMSKCPACAAARRSASVASGSNRALASSINRPSSEPILSTRVDVGVHEPGRLRGQADGALGDEPQPPRRQLPLIRASQHPWRRWSALDRVGQVAPDSVERPRAAANSTTANSATSGHPSRPAADRTRAAHRHHQRLARHRRPSRCCPHHLPSLVVLGRLVGARRCPAHRRDHRPRRAGAAGRGHRGDQHCHRPPTLEGPRRPHSTGASDVFSESFGRVRSQRTLPVVSTSSTSGG